MPIKIVLRQQRDHSPYRRLMEQLLSAPRGDSAVICSGYIWQPDTGYNVLDDGLERMIVAGCSSGAVTTVAGKFGYQKYEDYYRNFVRRLRGAGLTVSAYKAPEKNWHAKIAIRLDQGVPIAALLGSSNLTGPAFGENRHNWNFEADVLIWIASAGLTGYFRNDGLDLSFGRIETILDPEVTQPDEHSQLKAIYADVLSNDLEEFN